CARLWNGLDYW
nr:immunoglobulin heavy chain junction region [Macaca mulatta]MOY21459.1 immunoglobulin heavy chain junction region [Macaca mulatta]MOY22133.1 immunoglobulin heavy chain junction region [Macaca mulatta]MOY22188.1 immunoglobulin heavy chain junction region [Macaca mulatta]MOY22712.1 immunoglobulin heavy chain junction region [Macaca mulatta]